MGHLGPKTRSPGQMIEKICVNHREHSFHLKFLKYGQNVCLDEVWVGIICESFWVKK